MPEAEETQWAFPGDSEESLSGGAQLGCTGGLTQGTHSTAPSHFGLYDSR